MKLKVDHIWYTITNKNVLRNQVYIWKWIELPGKQNKDLLHRMAAKSATIAKVSFYGKLLRQLVKSRNPLTRIGQKIKSIGYKNTGNPTFFFNDKYEHSKNVLNLPGNWSTNFPVVSFKQTSRLTMHREKKSRTTRMSRISNATLRIALLTSY